MRDVQRPAPNQDLDSPEEIAAMVRRIATDVSMDDLGRIGPNVDRARELADNVARVHSQQLIGQAISIERTATSPNGTAERS